MFKLNVWKYVFVNDCSQFFVNPFLHELLHLFKVFVNLLCTLLRSTQLFVNPLSHHIRQSWYCFINDWMDTIGANICISLCVLAFQFLQLQWWAAARQSWGPDASSKVAPAGLSLRVPRRLLGASRSPLAPRELLWHPTDQDGGSHPSHQHHKPAAQAGQRPAADTHQTRRPQQG